MRKRLECAIAARESVRLLYPVQTESVDITRNPPRRGLEKVLSTDYSSPMNTLDDSSEQAGAASLPENTDKLLERILFPAIAPYRSGTLQVDGLHTLYWEECGNPAGEPVLFLHGGPGGGLSPRHRRFFDPAHYRIVLFDQRGAGQSTPVGEVRNNTTHLLVDDIERLRDMLNIERWLVFGGSWGATLALAYGEQHPARCAGFILRGVFLCTQEEIDWFMAGMGKFFPEAHAAFLAEVLPSGRGDVLNAYAERLFGDDAAAMLRAARAWSLYESRCAYLNPHADASGDSDAACLAIARLEAHYFLNAGFIEDQSLIKGLERISHLPACIVQGRYDMICPPLTALQVHANWPGSRLEMIGDAGHAASEPGIAAALVKATEQFRLHGRFG
jgi:proline iminopeptidase